MNEAWVDGYEVLFENERNIGMQKALETIPSRTQDILKSYYYEKRTYVEIGYALRLTSERVSQIGRKGLRQLRTFFRLQILAEHGWERAERHVKKEWIIQKQKKINQRKIIWQ